MAQTRSTTQIRQLYPDLDAPKLCWILSLLWVNAFIVMMCKYYRSIYNRSIARIQFSLSPLYFCRFLSVLCRSIPTEFLWSLSLFNKMPFSDSQTFMFNLWPIIKAIQKCPEKRRNQDKIFIDFLLQRQSVGGISGLARRRYSVWPGWRVNLVGSCLKSGGP